MIYIMKHLFFTLSLVLFTSVLSAQEDKPKTQTTVKCSDFRTGEFIYIDEFTNVKVIRGKKIQTEDSPEGNLKLKIKWLSDCVYTLTFISTTRDDNAPIIGQTIHCEIILIDEEVITVSCEINNSKFTTKMKKIK